MIITLPTIMHYGLKHGDLELLSMGVVIAAIAAIMFWYDSKLETK